MNVKIFNITHKPCLYINNDYISTIHAGRAIAKDNHKDGKLTQDDLKSLLQNTIGDDSGENISNLNRYINEMSVIYWVYKHYNEIGCPNYIGFMHYRRHFNLSNSISLTNNYVKDLGLELSNINNILKDFDIIHPPLTTLDKPIIEEIGFFLGTEGGEKLREVFNKCIKILQNKQDLNSQRVLNLIYQNNLGPLCNMFIAKKDLFFEYCQWIFPIIFDLIKNDKQTYNNFKEIRSIGWTCEILTSLFFYNKFTTHPHKAIQVFNPASFRKKSILYIPTYRLKAFLNIKKHKNIQKLHYYLLFKHYFLNKSNL